MPNRFFLTGCAKMILQVLIELKKRPGRSDQALKTELLEKVLPLIINYTHCFLDKAILCVVHIKLVSA